MYNLMACQGEELFHDFILTVSSRYTQQHYDLLSNNCNNFSQVAWDSE